MQKGLAVVVMGGASGARLGLDPLRSQPHLTRLRLMWSGATDGRHRTRGGWASTWQGFQGLPGGAGGRPIIWETTDHAGS